MGLSSALTSLSFEEAGEQCSVSAVLLRKPDQKYPAGGAAYYAYRLAVQQTNRGRAAAGIMSYDPKHSARIKLAKGLGTPEMVFSTPAEELERHMRYLNGTIAISHTRYQTSGTRKLREDLIRETQPMDQPHVRLDKKFGMAFNGNIANYPELRAEYFSPERMYHLETEVDTELIMGLLSMHLARIGWEKGSSGAGSNAIKLEAVQRTCKLLDGAHNVVTLFADGTLVAWRDAGGWKPLNIGWNDSLYAVASESGALPKIDIPKQNIRAVEPGELIIFENGEPRSYHIYDGPAPPKRAITRCSVEFSYNGRPDSLFDGSSIEFTRLRLGDELALSEPLKPEIDAAKASGRNGYVVVPAPRTAVIAAQAFARKLGVDFDYAVDKSVEGRNFIMDDGERKLRMPDSFSVGQRVEGKKVLLVDDTLIKGDTSTSLVRYLFDEALGGGASEVHVRSTSPPFISPCYYGMDFNRHSKLPAAGHKTIAEIEEAVRLKTRATSVHYQTMEVFLKALGFEPGEGLCTACFTGKYPTPFGQLRAEESWKLFIKDRTGGVAVAREVEVPLQETSRC